LLASGPQSEHLARIVAIGKVFVHVQVVQKLEAESSGMCREEKAKYENALKHLKADHAASLADVCSCGHVCLNDVCA
jgi:hypothetical protein